MWYLKAFSTYAASSREIVLNSSSEAEIVLSRCKKSFQKGHQAQGIIVRSFLFEESTNLSNLFRTELFVEYICCHSRLFQSVNTFDHKRNGNTRLPSFSDKLSICKVFFFLPFVIIPLFAVIGFKAQCRLSGRSSPYLEFRLDSSFPHRSSFGSSSLRGTRGTMAS